MTHTTAELARTLIERGAADEAQALVEAALQGATGVGRADLLLALAQAHGHRGEHLRALALSVEASEFFQAGGQPARVCDALVFTATTLRSVGDHDTALSTLEHAETLARGAGDHLRTARVLRQIGVVSSMVGRHQHALSCLEEACAAFARAGQGDEQRHARLSVLNARHRRADNLPDSPEKRSQAEASLPEWIALAEDAAAAGQARLAVMAWGNHAITLQPAGRPREAADALRALIPRYREYGMRPNEGLAHGELARCHEKLGENALALQHYREAVAVLREGGAQVDLLEALEGVARTEEAGGDVAAALAALKEWRAIDRQRRDEAARQALLQRELRVELARLTHQWARQAMQDPLTGLANRRGLERWIDEHWPRVEQGQPLVLLLLDLDHFKRVNDHHGHDVGDLVLRQVAVLLQAHARHTDLATRYGGEEFLLAMAGTARHDAEAVAQRLREAIAGHDWGRVAAGLTVTTSIGVADATEVLNPAALLTLADRRLYAAKYSGRDRVVVHG